MANISNIKIGNTSYTVKDNNAAPVYNLSAYQTSTSVLPSDFYKANFHVSGEPVEMKYLKTTSNTTECSPLNTNTTYIVFGLNRQEASGYYWGYYVYTYSDRKYVGCFNTTSGVSKRPTILNKAFFDETDYSKVVDVVDDYYNSKGFVSTIEITDNIGIDKDIMITDEYGNEVTCTFPCCSPTQSGVMTKTQYNLLNKLGGVQNPIDISSQVKTWLADNNNGGDTTSTINSGSVINDIYATTESNSATKVNQYKLLYFTITSNTTLRNGTNNTTFTLYPGTYLCTQLGGYLPNQIASDAYYTFQFVSTTATSGGITIPKLATGFIHLVYKDTSSYVGWAIERIGKCSLSYLTTS